MAKLSQLFGASSVAAFSALAYLIAPAAAASSSTCPTPGDMPTVDNSPIFTDQNVAVFAGGDYVAAGDAAESEGVLVVAGDATFSRKGLFNIGSVGAGSGIVPPSGSTMLRVGGNLTIDELSVVSVGATLPDGGNASVGEEQNGTGELDLNGGVLTTGQGAGEALGRYPSLATDLTDASTELALLTTTGSSIASGNALTLTGTNSTQMEIFSIPSSSLTGVKEIYLTDIANTEVPILINVVGASPVSLDVTYVSIDSQRVDDLASSDFGNAASQLMWNFSASQDLTIAGSGQFMGSIIAPHADTSITASTNGRVLVGGDLLTSGIGNEQHNYPWVGMKLTACDDGEPTPTPTPTNTPTETPTPEPTGTPTSTPTPEPTGTPTSTPTPEPTGTPTSTPTDTPSSTPSSSPSASQSELPRTGLDARAAGIVVVLLVGSGFVLMSAGRRSRR